MNNVKEITISIIGMGRIGRVHYQNIIKMPHIHIKTICDLLADPSWLERYEVEQAVTNYEEVLRDSAIDAVLICTPTNLHPLMIKAAAEAGKAIFCEKPLGFDADAIMEAYDVVQTTGVDFAVGFNRRFDSNFDGIVNLRRDGKLGKPQILKITSRDPEPPTLDYVRRSGGLFMDMTIHDFDMARFITGQEISSVFATGSVLIDSEIGKAGDIDTAIVTLNYANGMVGVIDNSRQAVYGYDQRIELFGSEGMAKAGNVIDSTTQYTSANAVSSGTPMYFFLQRYQEAYANELRSFFEMMNNEHGSDCTYEDGIRAIRVAQAANKSLISGQLENVAAI